MTLGGTIHVLANDPLPINFQNGTPAAPFATVGQAHVSAWPGARILAHGGSCDEAVTLTEPVQVLGTGGTLLIGL
jgi:hypothetical protein